MSENNLPAIGTYKARRYEAIRIGEAKTGALCAYIPCELIPDGFQLEHTLVLYKADGTSMTGNLQTLQQVFPTWTVNAEGELNPFDLAEIPLTEEGKAEFKLADCFHEEYNGKLRFKAQWFNALGREEAAPEEVNAIKNKWSAKFKQAAALVKTPITKPTPAPAVVAEVVPESAPEVKSTPKRAAKAKEVQATKPQYDTSEAIFAALLKKHNDKNDEEVANHIWYPACDELFGANNLPSTTDDLAKLAEKLGL